MTVCSFTLIIILCFSYLEIQYAQKLLRIAFFHNIFIAVVLVNLLPIGILRKESYEQFLAVINCFSAIFCYLYLYIRQRGVKSQNKMDFERFPEVCVLH